ncbi:hypothetical protein BDV59DRAFT_201603 [Aspergillus ambiguus]|uniref:uncharacterized protein n=1 Tax=Aspergillus ambiguus TaxID=176160 RepID=UPI003CCE0865
MAQLVAAQVADVDQQSAAPYNADFAKYCNNGTTEGTLVSEDTTYDYRCDVRGDVGSQTQIKAKSAKQCAELIDMDDDDSASVWDHNTGNCWSGVERGKRHYEKGFMVITATSPLATCQAELDDLKGPPSCNGSSRRKVGETKGVKFFYLCNTEFNGGNKNSGTADSYAACVERCAAKSDCDSVTWNRENKKCWIGTGDPFKNSKTQYNIRGDSAMRFS